MNFAIAVLDIGMTNKKVAVYDDQLSQVFVRYRNFSPKIIDEMETHDLEEIESWIIAQLSEAASLYPIKAISVSTHGATFVCVGKDGRPSVPCVYYTHEPGDDFQHRFYKRFGDPLTLQKQTGTPPLKAMINAAKGILFAKETFPDQCAQTEHILYYSQYWGFRFTGKVGMEGTYPGCHTYLWDQLENKPSSVAEDLGIVPFMQKQFGNSWDIQGTITSELAKKTGLPKDVIVTMGIHDSNAALLPHIAKQGKSGFVVNSTGTWCVSMKAVNEYGFKPEDLGKIVFFNISAFKTPVKTAIFLGGQEFEIWMKLLQKIHNRKDFPPDDEKYYQSILKEQTAFLMPELIPGSGQFPQSKARIIENGKIYLFEDIESGASIPNLFQHYEEAYALLNISLAMQSLTALERTGLNPGESVFTEGGFKKNQIYNTLVSAGIPSNKVFLTDIAEASALGAAMIARMALTGQSLQDLADILNIDYYEVEKPSLPEVFSYREAWLKHSVMEIV
ncbi:MAG: carbohydrate kinase [Treponema sp.]|nr:carbohydrate kinase [Treponema sp.]